MTQKANNRQSQNEFVAMLQKCINAYEEADKLFDEVNDFIENVMPEQTSRYDSEQQDYLHILESYELSDEQLITVGRKLEENRDERRNWHNIYNVAQVWKEHKLKVNNKNSRVFLRENIKKALNNLDNCSWKFRVLSDEQVDNLLEVKRDKTPCKKGRKSTFSQETIKQIVKLYKENKKIKDIAKQFNMNVSTCYSIARRNKNMVI